MIGLLIEIKDKALHVLAPVKCAVSEVSLRKKKISVLQRISSLVILLKTSVFFSEIILWFS